MMRAFATRLFVGLLVLAAAAPAHALVKKLNTGDSETACVNWCFDHNKTTYSRDKCLNQCECYYHGNLCLQFNGTTTDSAPRPSGAN